MQASGELIDNKIIVKKSKDVGRLYTKSHFGKSLPGNKIELDLIESVFLLSESKIRIFHNKNELGFQDLVKIAALQIPDFEIKYLIFKDLRNRGHPIKPCGGKEHSTFYKFRQKKGEKQCFISAFSERDFLDLENTKKLINEVTKKNGELWFGIVDEEGDITYYDVTLLDFRGDIGMNVFPKGEGVLLKNRTLLFDKKLSENLLEKEFFGKPFGDGLQLSLVEALYLSEKGVIEVQTANGKKLTVNGLKKIIHKLQPDIETRFFVFKDLKKRGFIVKTGFKFGAHFRAYTKHIDEAHAEYLIHVVDKGFKSTWAEMSRAVRLAHSVNKEIVFARVDDDIIDYIKLGRLRP
ncbi:MAG: tRNA-intron lyase [Thermoplasmatales archaeon]|nr:MAG: tRNA-intron lyase [Thermoplasmatales archaeon]